MIALAMSGALLMDWLLGEPRRAHPLVGFGRLARGIEQRLHANARGRGVLALLVAVLPFVLLAVLLEQLLAPAAARLLDIALLYFAVGHRSLHEHAAPIADALQRGDGEAARALAARIVSRDRATLDPANAATESVLENGNDAVFGALFWFALGGGAGALLYRLANTLDAMWGYRSARYAQFGWAAARFDDLLNWLPARLTAISYALLGHTRQALRCWQAQAPLWDSPNAGPVMAAGAGALGVRLGGAACYDAQWHARPVLGCGSPARGDDIRAALRLVRRGVLLWVAVVALIEAVAWSLAHA